MLLAITLIPTARPWVQSSHQSIWLPGNVLMDLKLGESRFNNATLDALNTWNNQLQLVSFTSRISTGQQEDYKNDMYFAADYEGEDLGDGVLAVTFIYTFRTISEINQLFETDIVFNTDYDWELYTGPPVSGTPDFRRVALHELGHVLGLGHPDESGQSVTAIMNAYISSVYTLQADDISGGQNLYRAPGNTSSPGNNNFASAYSISLSSGTTQATGENFYANKEAGEPDHDPGEGAGGQSVWWKWTAPSNGDVTVDTKNSTFDTLLGVYTGGSVSSLTTVGVNDDDDAHEPSGYQYRYSRVDFTATAGTTYYFAVDGWDTEQGRVKLTVSFNPSLVHSAPSITSQTASQTIQFGQTAQFSVTASGYPSPTYQWQRLPAGGGVWNDISNGINYTGATSSTLSVSGTTFAMSGDRFRCVVTNYLGSATSSPATLTVNPLAPSFTTHPVSQQKTVGSSVTFTAAATGQPTPTYQWQKDGVNIAGATGSSYTRTNLTADDAGTYRVIASNSAGNATSNSAVLTVLIPPSFTAQPVSQEAVIGDLVTITAAATGIPAPTYQWQKNGVNVPGAIHATYTIVSATLEHTGTYRVIATNSVGTATSNAVTLTVRPPGPSITSLSPTRQIYTPGQSTTLFVTGTSVSETGFINYQWIHNGREIAGANSPNLPLNNLTKADSGWYVVVLTDSNGIRRSSPIFVYVGPAQTQVRAWGQTASQITPIPEGLTDIQSVVIGGAHALGLRLNGTVIGWGSTVNAASIPPENLGQVVAISSTDSHSLALKSDGTVIGWGSNDYGESTIPANLSDVVAISAGNDHSLALKSDGTVVGWGYNYSGESSVPNGLANVVSISAGGAYSLALKADGTVVAWGYNAYGQTNIPAGLANAAKIAAGYDHAVALRYDGTVIGWGDNSNGESTIPAGLTNAAGIATGRDLSLAYRSDGSVIAWGRGNSGQTNIPSDLSAVFELATNGNVVLALRDATGETAPIITSQPVNQSAAETQQVIFSITATGVGPITYQWRKNGTAIPGAVSSTYTIPSAAPTDAGNYDVIATNYIGSTTSSVAVLTVNAPAEVTHMTSARQIITLGESLSLAVTASGTGALSYQWVHNGRPIEGATDSTYTVNSTTLPAAGWYVVLVTDNNGTVRSAPFFVIVTPAGQPIPPRQLRGWGPSHYGPFTQTDVVRIASGYDSSLILRSDGSVEGVGDNSYGRLNIPAGLSGVVDIALNSYASFALKADGTVTGWGSNSSNLTTIPEGLTNVVALAAGGNHVLALKADGTVVAWGGNHFGASTIPTELTDVVAVRASGNYSLVLKADGTVRGWGSLSGASPPNELSQVVDIALSNRTAMALRSDGTIVEWGRYTTEHYDLGPSLIPTPMPEDLTGVVSIGAGESFSYAVETDGTVVPWGYLSYFTNSPISDLNNIITITGGSGRYLALRDASNDTAPEVNVTPANSTLQETQSVTFTANVNGAGPWTYQWFFNDEIIPDATAATLTLENLSIEEAGDYSVVVSNLVGPTTSNTATLTVIPLARITPLVSANQIVSLGQTLTLSATASGTGNLSYQWTRNGRAIVGATSQSYTVTDATHQANGWYHLYVTDDNGTRRSPTFFVRVAPTTTQIRAFGTYPPELAAVPVGINNAVQVAGGSNHGVALRADGTVIAWGNNNYEQATVPDGLTDVVSVSAAYHRSMALKADGTVVSWGRGGNSTSDAEYVAIACGEFQNLALRANGTVFAWGSGTNGLLNIPDGLSGVISIATGEYYSLALKNDGTAVVWGYDRNNSEIPPGLSNLAELIGGNDRTYAIKDDGSVIGWRYYRYGTLSLVIPEGLTNAQAMANGVAITADGSVLSWSNSETSNTSTTLEVDQAFDVATAGGIRFVLRDASNDTAPVITTPPASQSLVTYQPYALSVSAEGSAPLSYQWRKNGTDITGATDSTLSFVSITVEDAGNYDVVVSNHLGSVTSAIAVLTVNPAPVITSTSTLHPFVSAGQPLSMQVAASGSGALTYQWFFNGTAIVGATNATYTIGSVSLRHNGRYEVAVTDANGTRYSPPFTTTITPTATQFIAWGSSIVPFPSGLTDVVAMDSSSSHSLFLKSDHSVVGWGDNPHGQISIPTGLGNVVAVAAGGRHSLALKEDGTVMAWGYSNGGVIAVPDGLSHVTAIAAGGDFSLALKEDGTVVAWGRNDNGQATVPANLHQVVAIAAGGGFAVALQRDGRVITWGDIITPTNLPPLIAISAGGYHALGLDTAGNVFAWGADYESQSSVPVGLTNIRQITAGWETSYAIRHNGTIEAWGDNADDFPPYPGSLTNTVILTAGWRYAIALIDPTPVTSPIITNQPQSALVNIGTNAVFSVAANGSPAPSYQWQRRPAGSTVWSDLVETATYSGTTSTSLTITDVSTTMSGDLFRCLVSNESGSDQSDAATLNVTVPLPVITTQPISQAASLGASVTLSVDVESPVAVSYQWRRNDTIISGATSSTYVIDELRAATEGYYTVVVTNSAGSVTSVSATVAIALPPTIITQPVSRTIYTGQSATFSVTATSNAPLSYQWQFEGEDIPDATSSSYTVANAQASNAGSYTVVVSTIAGTRTSNPATLTVNEASVPAFTLQPENQVTVVGRPAVFTVSATGNPSPTYQWQVKRFGDDTWYNTGDGGGSYSGSATNSLSVTSGVATQGDQYRSIATNLAGSITSIAATLTVGTSGFTKISAGRYHSARVGTDGKAYTSGFNSEGQLGNGTTTNVVSPQQMALNGHLAADVAAGAQHTLILATDKSLWATGFNSSGQLGDGTTVAKSSPILLANDVTAFAAGLAHSAYIKTDGTLWTVGGNDSGQLGNGSTTDSSTATQVASDVVDVSTGLRQTLFLRSDGSLWGMGDMNGSGTPVTTPVQIATGVKAMAAGGYHSLFVKTDGTLWTMGYNPFGQLGNGTTTSSTTPVQITTGVRSVAAGYFHSLFIKTDGSLWAMGYNSGGQLGDDTNTNRLTPIQVTTNVTSVAGSESYTLFTKSDGTLWGTGYNAYGQFGNGLTVTTTWPNQIQAGTILHPAAPVAPHASSPAPHDRVHLTWTPDGNASSYEVWRSATNDPAAATRIALDLRWASFVDRSTSLNQTYYYWIKAVNATGTSSFSSTASATTGSILAQTISFAGPADQTFSTSPITLTATASSGLPVAYTLVSGPATLSGNELILTGTGTITVRASQAGNSSYSAAVDVERSFTVSAANATVTLDDLSATYDGNPHAVTATTDPNGLTVILTYDGEATAPTNAGSYAVVGTIEDENHAGSASGTLVIAKASQTITFDALVDRAFTPSPLTLSATASSGLTVTFAVQSGPATLDGNQLTLTDTGSVTVRASQAGNGNYFAADPVDRSFNVTANALSWLNEQFTPSELADESISGATADPDRDGLTNLLEYALGLDPMDTDTASLPEAGSSTTDWTYTYTRPADRPDLTYEVEYSTDLATWSTAGVTLSMTADHGSTQTWRATLPLNSASNVFFRLKISQN
ncbi:MAG: immunoglobulin domain-containing protein [Opitutaceae bacterium]